MDPTGPARVPFSPFFPQAFESQVSIEDGKRTGGRNRMENGVSRIFVGFTNFFESIQPGAPAPLPPAGRILVFEKEEGTLFCGSDGLAMATITWKGRCPGGTYSVQAGRGERLVESFSTPQGLLEFLSSHEENALRYVGQINLDTSNGLAHRVRKSLPPEARWAFRSRRKIEIGFGEMAADVIAPVGMRIESFPPFFLPFLLFQKLSGFFSGLHINEVDLFLKFGEKEGPWSPPVVLLSGTDSNGNRVRALTGGSFFSGEIQANDWWG